MVRVPEPGEPAREQRRRYERIGELLGIDAVEQYLSIQKQLRDFRDLASSLGVIVHWEIELAEQPAQDHPR